MSLPESKAILLKKLPKSRISICGCGKIKDKRSKRCNECANSISWTKEEDDIIKVKFPTTSSVEIAKLIKRSHSAIRHRAVFLGIANNKESNSYKMTKYNKVRGKLGKNSTSWKGGRVIKCDGYILISSPNHPFANTSGYVFEHRLVVEKFIGRMLNKNEVVHHINQKNNDNRIENLMVFQSQAEHRTFHIKMQKFPYFTNQMKQEIENRWNYLKILDSNPKLKEAING